MKNQASDSTANINRLTWREDRYRAVLQTPGKSALLVKIWRDVFGEDYPEEADPFGFVTVSDLNRFVLQLKLRKGDRLLDIGCGRGGPGSWVARRTGADLIGIDVLPEAVAQANERRSSLEGSTEAVFSVGSFTNTGLPSAYIHGIMSVDSFWMVLDKSSALREMSRVIQSGCRFAMTSWMPTYIDIGAMLSSASFSLLSCEETERWKDRQVAVYEGILKFRAELVAEMGGASAEVLIAEAEQAPVRLLTSPRFFVVAERQ